MASSSKSKGRHSYKGKPYGGINVRLHNTRPNEPADSSISLGTLKRVEERIGEVVSDSLYQHKRPRMDEAALMSNGVENPSIVGQHASNAGPAQEQSPEDVKAKERPIYLLSRCTPSRFSKTIKKFNEEQCEAVRHMGLGGLLEIQHHTLDMKLIDELATRFDPATCKLNVHGRVIQFTVHEVAWFLGLANSVSDVPDECPKNEHANIRVRYNLGRGHTTVRDIEVNLHQLTANEFKANFLMYAINTILSPSTGLGIRPKYLGLLRNLEDCSFFNWAKFTFEGIVAGVRAFQGVRDAYVGQKYITGCVMLLQLWYLERIFVVGGPTSPLCKRDRPRVKDWNAKAIGKVLHIVNRTVADLDDNKIQILDDDVDGNEPIEGLFVELRNMFVSRMDILATQQAQILAKQDALEVKFDRLCDDLIQGKRIATPNTASSESAFVCPICMAHFNEETTTRCGHIFCKKCITSALALREECPTCMRRVVAKDLIRVFLPRTD